MKRVLLVAALLVVAFCFPQLGASVWRRLENRLSRLSKRPVLAMVFTACLSFAISAAIGLMLGASPPHIHDEFANLLAADTFAHGRLSNPTHPLWPFFEGIHINSQPTYGSKYPIAQGLMLALGQALTGHPEVGMWISAALACAALVWMLWAWMPPRWALLGGLLAATHPVIVKWSQVYWGGLEAVIGGALILGAARRIMDGPRPSYGVCWAVGLAFLANSRPYEGFVLSVIVTVVFLFLIARRKQPAWPILFKNVAVPAGAVMSVVFLMMGFYNYRTTGNPLHMPYMEYEKQYAVAPFMVWQKPRPIPEYRHAFIRDHMVKYALAEYEEQQNLPGFLSATWMKFQRLADTTLWEFNPWYAWLLVLVFPLVALTGAIRRQFWLRVTACVFVLFAAALVLETWMWDRYAAPIAAVVALLILQGLRQLRTWRWHGKHVGLFITRFIVLGCLLTPIPWSLARAKEYALHDWDWQRLQIIKQLGQSGGKHLIVVRYGPGQIVHDDWVHNAADIDGSQIIWARDMGAEQNRKLFEYFDKRKIWLLEPGKKPVQLVPYPTNELSAPNRTKP